MRRHGETGIAQSSVQRGAGGVPGRPGAAADAQNRRQSESFSGLDETAALQVAVRNRIDEGVRRVLLAIPREHLYEALSTDSPVDALIYIMSQEAAVAQAVTAVDDPLRAAKARAAKRMAELLSAEGGPIGVEAVAERLRISRAAVDKRRRAGTLIGVNDGGRPVLYPGWQFTETGLLPGLDEALRKLGVRDPWMRMGFFLSPDPDLGARPLDALRDGRIADVSAAAHRYGRQGEDG